MMILCKRPVGFSFLLILMMLGTGAASSEAASGNLTLEQAYRLALARSESLAIQEESLKVAEAHTLQALGTALPHIEVRATELVQDTSATGGSGTDVGSTFTRRSRPEVALTLSQPLFQGFREFKALKVAGAEKKRDTHLVHRARQTLFADVARAYYTVLEAEREYALREQIKTTLFQRIQELMERLRLGKSRESELLATEAELAQAVAEADRAKGLVFTAHDYLGFLIGEDVNQKLVDSYPVPSSAGPLEHWLSFLDRRPDLKALEESVRLAKGQLDYEKGGRYPALNLDANYYPYRAGFQNDIKWDLGFTMTVPIFKGGATRGLIREAASGWRQAELEKTRQWRQAETEVRQAYHTLQSSLKETASLRASSRKAGASYEKQVEEYRLGLVNNLEVLQSLRSLQEARVAAMRAYFQAKLNSLQLKLAAGDIPDIL